MSGVEGNVFGIMLNDKLSSMKYHEKPGATKEEIRSLNINDMMYRNNRNTNKQ